MHRRCTILAILYDAAVQSNGLVLESVGKFCYLGNMLTADGGADSAVVNCEGELYAWKKFRELFPS